MKQLYKRIGLGMLAVVLLLQFVPAGADGVHDRIMKQAIKAYRNLQYDEAAALLKDVVSYKKMSDDLIAEEMLAISLHKLDRIPDALFWYRKLVYSHDPKPSWFLNYARLLANMEMYDSAAIFYDKYSVLKPEDKRGAAFAKAYADIAGLKKGDKNYQIYFANINTDASEYSPAFYNGGLLFTTNRRVNRSVKNVFGWNKSPYSDIYHVDTLSEIRAEEPDSILADVRRNPAKYKNELHALKTANMETSPGDNKRIGFYDETMDADTLGAVVKVQGVHELKGVVNSRFHEGTCSVLPDGNIYYTHSGHKRNAFGRSNDGVFKLQIYYTLGKNQELREPFKYNDEDYNNGHPALSKDGLLLVFTSDMPGTIGGTDLFYCTREKTTEQWSTPQSMGTIVNTLGNEAFPYLDADGNLYFASDGLPGLGGYDIFKVALNTRTHKPEGEVSHLGAPVNSSKDDFGFIWSNDIHTGYFSSNRRGNDDIYIIK